MVNELRHSPHHSNIAMTMKSMPVMALSHCCALSKKCWNLRALSVALLMRKAMMATGMTDATAKHNGISRDVTVDVSTAMGSMMPK